MSPTRLLLFAIFLGALANIVLFVTRDPGLHDPLVADEIARDSGFVQIAVAPTHACAVGAGGGVWCWGEGRFGQLGHGRFSDSATPVPVVALPERAIGVSVGGGTSCATLESGALYCWGAGPEGQLGLPAAQPASALPTRIPGLGPVMAVAVGMYHVCASERDGGLSCWGDLRHGDDGDVYLESHRLPQPIEDAPVLATLSAGDNHTCGTTVAGELWCWGGSDSGALGMAGGHPMQVAATPHKMAMDAPVRAFATGTGHSCALDTQGDVWCWGQGAAFHAEALGGAAVHPTPLRVAHSPKGQEVAAGWNTACVGVADGPVRCIGADAKSPWAPFPDGTPALTDVQGRGTQICGLDAQGGAWCASLSPTDRALTTEGLRPIDWKIDNSIAARWNRLAGFAAGSSFYADTP